jgi:hypothetical protein
LLWISGLLYTLIKGKFVYFMGSDLFGLDFLTIFTAYLFQYYGRTGAGLFAMTQGLFMDLFSGGMNCLFTMLYLLVFGFLCLESWFFNLQSPKGQALIVFFAMLSKSILFILIVMFISEKVSFSKYFFLSEGILAFATALTAPVCFFVLDRLRDSTPHGY